MRRIIVISTFFLLAAIASPCSAVLFTENIGTGTPSGTAIGSYTGWQNNATLSFSGSGDVRNSVMSSGYTGASANGNVFLTSGGTQTFEIASINTSAYLPTFTLSFGAIKTTNASDMSELQLDYSADGTNYTPITIP